MLDGNELHCLSLEEVQDLFFKRQLNQDSLVCNAEDGQWHMLKRVFDLSQWISSGASQVATQNNYQPQVNPFEQMNPADQANNFEPPPNPADQPVTFNQFPQNPPSNNFGQNTSNGYSQNNQTETYYQAETNQTNYNFQNNPTNYAPSKYNNPAGSYNYSPNLSNTPEKRNGLRAAAGFLFVNALFYVAYMIFGSTIPEPSGVNSSAYNAGRSTGAFLPLLIDLILAVKLWRLDDGDSARKWVLFRSYFGFIVFGLIFPVIMLKTGNPVVAGFSFISTFFYFISLAIVLHGKENPAPSRVIIGSATFAVYFLIMFGTLGLAFIGKHLPDMAKFNLPNNPQFEKYKIEGKEYEDKITGAKIVLPEGWSMLKMDNPVVRTPTARMIAVDKGGNRLTMLEVVPVPGNLDMKKQNPAVILDKLADNVVGALNDEVMKNGGIGGRDDFKEVTRLSIYIGKHPAKLLVFDKTEQGEKMKGHLIITYDELTFYVLHSWCPAAEYEQAQNDFTFFEKNFTVPEKINSSFTQTADNDKKP